MQGNAVVTVWPFTIGHITSARHSRETNKNVKIKMHTKDV